MNGGATRREQWKKSPQLLGIRLPVPPFSSSDPILPFPRRPPHFSWLLVLRLASPCASLGFSVSVIRLTGPYASLSLLLSNLSATVCARIVLPSGGCARISFYGVLVLCPCCSRDVTRGTCAPNPATASSSSLSVLPQLLLLLATNLVKNMTVKRLACSHFASLKI